MFERVASNGTAAAAVALPRLGFAGVGWIGRKRMESVVRNGKALAAAVFDPALPSANDLPRETARCGSFEELIHSDVDGIVIATPNALHASQAIAALRAGKAVFCQKPLARNTAETKAIVAAAREANRRIGVDFSYRSISGMQRIRDLITRGELGKIYAIDLVFHNAYGPDKPWFYNRDLSGGGCLLDLGVHLVDLAFWTIGPCEIEEVQSALMANGEVFRHGQIEDYASAQIKVRGRARHSTGVFMAGAGGLRCRDWRDIFWDERRRVPVQPRSFLLSFRRSAFVEGAQARRAGRVR